MAKNSLQLRKEMSLSQFYRLSHELATDYAHSATSVARTALTEKYDITISSYYTLLEFAVSHNLVKNDVVKKLGPKFSTIRTLMQALDTVVLLNTIG